ncbi:MAG: 23S rRNA (cytidine(2498)-2'-O)-methyltransferase RlmM [Gammaproteobacteria bacterium]
MRPVASLMLYCRAGFEKECAAEIAAVAAGLGVAGYCKAKPDAAYVQFVAADAGQSALLAGLRVADLVFARQLFFSAEFLKQLPVTDRLAVLVPAIEALGQRFSALRMETADTNEAKELSVFCRKFAQPLRQALARAGIEIEVAGAPVLHLFFLGSAAVQIGWSHPANASPWLMGIPRLKFPVGAPSRSTLKLEEAFLTFLTAEQRETLLRPGLTAVDLGAAPGGWTWQLVKYGLQVTAVDNGAMDRQLMASGAVEHVRADGFRYRPEQSVDWLVCDIVEQPSRIAALMGRWLASGWCRQAIFNLKLPMLKRYEEVQRCREILEHALSGTAFAGKVRFKQLYHDREEVTACVSAGERT